MKYFLYILISFSVIFFFSIVSQNTCFAQTSLYFEGFETDGEGSRYTTNTYSFCSGIPGANPDYFLRTNTNPVLPTGCTAGFGNALTNLRGDWFWASEDIRSNSPIVNGQPPGDFTSQSINILGYNNLTFSIYLATANNNNIRWEESDSINIKASIDGGPFKLFARFMGMNGNSGGNLRIDSNLDGVIDANDVTTVCDRSDFFKYTFSIPGTGSNLRIQLDFDQIGGTEELAWDDLELVGTPYTISSTPTTTTLSSNNNPSIFGQNVTFTAIVSPNTATGTVTFKDGATTLGTGTLSSGQATFSTTSLSIASHSITAEYGGDGSNAASTSSALSQVVNCATPTAFSVTGGGSYCANGTGVAVGLLDSETNVNYQLKNGSNLVGSPATGTGSAISFGLQTTAAVYTVEATTTTGGCTAAMTGNATVTVTSLPTASISGNNGPICAGTNATFTLTGTSGATVTYNLNGGSSSTVVLTGGTATITVNAASANQTLNLVSISDGTCGQNLTGNSTVTVTSLPTASISGNNGPICTGTNATFTLTGTSGATVTYNLNGGSSSTVVLTGGTATVTVNTASANQTLNLISISDGTCGQNLTGNSTVTVTSLPTASISGNNGPICAGTNATFTLTGTISATVTYNLNGGSNSTIVLTGGTATVTVNAASANQTLNLVSVNVGTCSQNLTGNSTVTVNSLPTASISGNNGPICAGANAAFTLTGTNGATVIYNLNGGSSSTVVLAGGTATVTVNATSVNQTLNLISISDGTCGQNLTGNSTVTVTSLPTASISGNNGSICAGTNATFTLTGTSGATVTYNLNGGSSSTVVLTGGTATVTVNAASGNQTLNLVSVNVGSCSQSLTGNSTVTVNSLPTATISSNNGPICVGTNATFTLTGTSGATVTYNLNGGSNSTIVLTGGTATVAVNAASANQTLNLVSVNVGSCSQSLTGNSTVTVNSLPTASISGNNGPICAGSNATFTLTGTSGATVTYNLNGGSNSTVVLTGGTATVTVNAASGNQTLNLVSVNVGSCNQSLTENSTVTVNSLPTATISSNNGPICAGTNATFTLTGTSGATVTYNLNGGSNSTVILTGGTATVTVNTATVNQTLNLISISNGVCSKNLISSSTVSVGTASTGGIIVYNGSPFCNNAGVALVTRTGNANGIFSANSAGLSLNSTTGAVNLGASTPGTYLVTFTYNAACSAGTTTAFITITPAPSATIAYSNNPYCASSGTANVTLAGTTGGTFSSTSGLSINANTGQINLAASMAGSYVVTYTIVAANGCGEFKTTANVAITNPPSATIAYVNTPYCSNIGTASVTLTGSHGGTFSSTSGLSINANTGAIDLASSIAGSYVVTYTIAAANGCPEFKTAANVTITKAPSATIAYSNNPYCASAGTANVTLAGTTGGTFSSTSGLSIDANTGQINLAASMAGSYVVTYTIVAANGCGEFKTTANVAITNPPSATISYANTPYCSNAGMATVTLTGSQGGTFSSTTDLSINANTGAIDLASSMAGSYVVTYTIAAANGCPEFKTTTNVTITTAPMATIAYSNTPYCASVGTASVTLAGTTGGLFSSTTGLSINAGTGEINLLTSTAGSYVVTYTIAAVNGCGEFKTTANVAITNPPSATIAYANSPYCSNAGTAAVTLTGSQGGMFSSTSGLSINANTGAIDLASSMAGSYVVTYTIAAANGCPEFKTTTNVTITTAPMATIAYSNTPYCASAGTASVTLAGATSGVFSSTTGLSINAGTGEINLAASTAGSYFVTYTIAATNGCAQFQTTSNVMIQSVLNTPVILSNQSSSVCMGTEVLLYTNCPQGSTVLWSNNSTATILALNANNPSEQTLSVKCQQIGFCESPSSAAYTVKWSSTFSLTLINIGQSQSAIKATNAPKSAWSNQFITPDAGPTIETSTEGNPTIYYAENMNKTAPRYWTIHAETCDLGTNGSLTFDMLSKDEGGVERSYNTHENNAPYLMYANRSGFTELYAQNHPLYGFYQGDGNGGNVYDAGLPKGLYKLGIRYWDMKGWGSIYPATRKPQGNVLAYQEFWFRIQSKDGVGTGAARQGAEGRGLGVEETLVPPLGSDPRRVRGLEVMPNPVSNVLRLKVSDAKGQQVKTILMDASGRELLSHSFIPETNAHQEEFNVNELANGMYFLKVNAGEKQATLKVVKVQ